MRHCPHQKKHSLHCTMRKLVILAIAATCLMSVLSCSKCFTEDCAENDVKLIRFFSATDSTDLIITGKFLLDSLDITPLKVNENNGEPRYEVFKNPYFIAVYASENTAGFVFKLDSLPPDTLKFVIGATENDKCCSGVTTIESVTLNGVALPNGREDLNIAIYK